MRFATLSLATVFALSSTFALADAHKHHHHMHHSMHGGAATGNPNGTASGPTTLSGTGPSTFGGNSPGARSSTRQ